jgi:Flp pilus assembly pilin Flp
MEKVRHVLTGLASDDGGAAAPEYGLLIALIAMLIVAGALILGTELNNLLIALGTFFENARGGP